MHLTFQGFERKREIVSFEVSLSYEDRATVPDSIPWEQRPEMHETS